MDKVILITGANGHLGRAVAGHYLKLGWKVIGMVSKNSHSEQSLMGVDTYACDLLDEAETKRTIASAIGAIGFPDVAVLTAGGFAMGNLRETSGNELDRMMRLNFHTAFNPADMLIQQAQSVGKKIKLIFIGSKPGLYPALCENMVAYGLSKSLLISFAGIINKTGISKHALAYILIPSIIDSPANRKSMPQANFSDWLSPEQIARTISSMSFNMENDKNDYVIEKFAD